MIGILSNDTVAFQEELETIREELSHSEERIQRLVQSKTEITLQIEVIVDKLISLISQTYPDHIKDLQ